MLIELLFIYIVGVICSIIRIVGLNTYNPDKYEAKEAIVYDFVLVIFWPVWLAIFICIGIYCCIKKAIL